MPPVAELLEFARAAAAEEFASFLGPCLEFDVLALEAVSEPLDDEEPVPLRVDLFVLDVAAAGYRYLFCTALGGEASR